MKKFKIDHERQRLGGEVALADLVFIDQGFSPEKSGGLDETTNRGRTARVGR